ncbi:hypothetical protein LIER_26246 [Lithospermum erythrorhizon]|uniref:Retrovirus-related Pol polyprotein from transposon TNT 1-94-like beta-barrel domain-containing protein n=1 Tax=Lithospermum erythrorhizon TaxID=34254 RepID=A0AAV3RBN5_LITER
MGNDKLVKKVLRTLPKRQDTGIDQMNQNDELEYNNSGEILLQGKRSGDNTGVGFSGGRLKKQTTSLASTFVVAGSQSHQDHKKRYNCGKKGHVAPYCYRIYGRGRSKYTQTKMQWVKKEVVVSHVVFASLKATAWIGWYFDSGCSRHMTGNKAHLTNIEEVKTDYVTFGRGEKCKIIGNGSLNVTGLPNLEHVLLVEGLTSNFISISQLCDNGMKVAFNKETCSVNNQSEDLIMQGSRSTDNCYL